jgi:hypothetical protein
MTRLKETFVLREALLTAQGGFAIWVWGAYRVELLAIQCPVLVTVCVTNKPGQFFQFYLPVFVGVISHQVISQARSAEWRVTGTSRKIRRAG